MLNTRIIISTYYLILKLTLAWEFNLTFDDDGDDYNDDDDDSFTIAYIIP